MLTKTESSGAGAVSFLQEIRSPVLYMYHHVCYSVEHWLIAT